MSSKEIPTYEAIFEACEEGIIVVNRKGIMVLANQAASVLFGYDIDEIKGQTIDILLPKSIRQKHVSLRDSYNEDPRPRKMGAGRDLMALRKNGEEFPVEISLNQANLNNETHTVAFIIDITERKKFELALRKSEEQLIIYAAELENRVSKRTQELDATIVQLEEQILERKKAEEETQKALEKEKYLNELKSRFVSMASHEFRTPLSTMLSSASLISKYKDEETEDKRERHVQKIKNSINNLNNILNDFLSLAKLEEGKEDINFENIEIESLLTDVIEELNDIKKEGQTVNLISGNTHTLLTDPKILKNLATNLLSNAIKYSKENKEVIIEVHENEEHIRLSFKDQGIGIPLSEQQHLFERFFRAQNAINIQGTGLGLNIVKKYIEMLNGSITFESKENYGSTFIVTLPK